MGLDDGKPNPNRGSEIINLTTASAGEGEPDAIVAAAQWTAQDFGGQGNYERAANTKPPHQDEVEAAFGTESKYQESTRRDWRRAVPGAKQSDSYETVQDKVSDMVVAGFGARSQWSQEYKDAVMDRLKKGDPQMDATRAQNKQAVYDALVNGDKKLVGNQNLSGRQLEDAVNSKNYKDMLWNGIGTDYN